MLYDLVNTFEELKKYVFIVDRGNKGQILIQFKNDHFFHLVGLHYTNINQFMPAEYKTKAKQYKYIKKNIDKFNNILENQIKEKNSLQLRMETFVNVLDIFEGDVTNLFDLKVKNPGSLYDGDYGLLKIYEEINCLLGLIIKEKKENLVICAPQSWMASLRINKLVENKRPIFLKSISRIPVELYNGNI